MWLKGSWKGKLWREAEVRPLKLGLGVGVQVVCWKEWKLIVRIRMEAYWVEDVREFRGGFYSVEKLHCLKLVSFLEERKLPPLVSLRPMERGVGRWGEHSNLVPKLPLLRRWVGHGRSLEGVRISLVEGNLFLFDFGKSFDVTMLSRGLRRYKDKVLHLDGLGDCCGGFLVVDEDVAHLQNLEWISVLVRSYGRKTPSNGNNGLEARGKPVGVLCIDESLVVAENSEKAMVDGGPVEAMEGDGDGRQASRGCVELGNGVSMTNSVDDLALFRAYFLSRGLNPLMLELPLPMVHPLSTNVAIMAEATRHPDTLSLFL
ncbi:hypothetical protein CK203_043171 [Vitis vinifera]|uniref:DUF4283 domain-containing protein n=1 Tax=Vitis vinifera TaxID=29760 RepID=A0A438H309_VITVI|nr:hypothetical protein CK203_043171 [Vitis vinifera]